MTVTKGAKSAQAGEIDYELNSLGWKAFQDLCLAIAEEILKRPIQMFLPSKDGGRDGAFVGNWDGDPAVATKGSSTIQCKSTSKRHAVLKISNLKSELSKVPELAAKGLASDYIILTNYHVSGVAESEIKIAFEAAGAGCCRVFGADWITDQIRKSPRLRAMVPRIYGIGDLSQILDGRALDQANEILSSMGPDLSRFVITDAHRRSVRALLDHKFVLLLGDPASGKSTIAASLALAALDNWGCHAIRITHPSQVQTHWNPKEPKRLFWIDDAFGATQYQTALADGWNQLLPVMQAAIKGGSHFLLTSRNYVWRAAAKNIKTSAFPLLEQGQVVIDVQNLTQSEKSQILYNHLKLGDQERWFKTAIKPHLPSIAGSGSFLPETARRLGLSFFTRHLSISHAGVRNFVERPKQLLKDILKNLDRACSAAIALLFMRGGSVPSPIIEDASLDLATSLIGVTIADIREAMNSLYGSLTILRSSPDGPYWTYKHPTIADAYASLVTENPELTEIYLRGARVPDILGEVVCGDIQVAGAAVRVPVHLYDLLLERMEQYDVMAPFFLVERADREFISRYLAAHPTYLDSLLQFHYPVRNDIKVDVLARIHRMGLLPEPDRLKVVAKLERAAIDIPDASFLEAKEIKQLLMPAEVEQILKRVEDELVPYLEDIIDNWRGNYDTDQDPEGYFSDLLATVEVYSRQLHQRSEVVERFLDARAEIQTVVKTLSKEFSPPPDDDDFDFSSELTSPDLDSPSEIFEDVDE